MYGGEWQGFSKLSLGLEEIRYMSVFENCLFCHLQVKKISKQPNSYQTYNQPSLVYFCIALFWLVVLLYFCLWQRVACVLLLLKAQRD